MQIPQISLRQLILFGFVISLIPLAYLLWQSSATINRISQSSISLIINTANAVRYAESMKSQLNDLERAIRQYRVLQSRELDVLANNQFNNYKESLNLSCHYLADDSDPSCDRQTKTINHLQQTFPSLSAESLNEEILTLRTQQSGLSEKLWAYLDSTLNTQKSFVAKRQKHMQLLLVTLVLATAVMIFLSSGQLVKPVRQLEKKIKHIGKVGTSDFSHERTFQGAKEFKQINEQLNWLNSRLGRLESLRQAFLRHAAHELKTPLSSIKEGCAILTEKLVGPLTDQQFAVVGLIEEGTNRLVYLTESLLDYDYLLQQPKPNLMAINPAELIDETLSIYQLSFIKRHQTVTVSCQLETVYSDKRLFVRILDNLLNNAQAYGKAHGEVLIALTPKPSSVQLMIANNSDIAAKAGSQKLFEPFQRGETSRQDTIRSNGLGLSIVRDCAQLLDGEIHFIEHPDFNFCLCITLPQPNTQDHL